jgi:hypothetical protein
MSSPSGIGTKEWVDRFHAHLDVCKQCEQHPFELCPVGTALLMGKTQAQSSNEQAVDSGRSGL